MARKLDGNYITANTITTTQLTTTVVSQISAGGGPKVTTITYPNNATAAVNTGNESIVLTGTGFESGVQVYINGAAAPAVSRTNSTSLSFTTPALTTGTTYPLYVVNPDGGTAVVVPGMVVSAGPVWITASPLSSWGASSSLSRQLQANSDSTVSYALEAGSSLPSGITLAANGLLSGTLTSPPVAQTTYNFTVTATDLELQKSSKAFSVNATMGIGGTGGTITNSGEYTIHTFTSSGTFTVNGDGFIECLVVAGGGGGGSHFAAGGGAGGYRTGSNIAVTAGSSYAVTVGGGGNRGTNAPFGGINGSRGSNSVFSSITSAGGGGGGSRAPSSLYAATSGGSGGGGGNEVVPTTGASGNVPATSPSQGNNGGNGYNSDANSAGGGGGGAGAVGGNASPNTGGIGGNGTASSITGSSVTYAGGGGGSGASQSSAGGSGGGGAGGNPSGIDGTANRGGGGGGGQAGSTGGAGGSGIVIIRYLT